MAFPRNALVTALLAWAARLRFPVLFGLTAALFLVDLVTPDPIPFVDETLLGLVAVMLGNWRKQQRGESPAPPSQETRP